MERSRMPRIMNAMVIVGKRSRSETLDRLIKCVKYRVRKRRLQWLHSGEVMEGQKVEKLVWKKTLKIKTVYDDDIIVIFNKIKL